MSKKHRRSATAEERGRRRRLPAAPWIAMAAVLLIAAAILLLIPKEGLPAEVNVARAHAMYEQGALFVDVRTQQEWDQGHIAGSLLMPLDELQARMDELPRDRDIVVVCKLGARSREGANILRDAGFGRATCMSGGILAWIAAGYPVEK